MVWGLIWLAAVHYDLSGFKNFVHEQFDLTFNRGN